MPTVPKFWQETSKVQEFRWQENQNNKLWLGIKNYVGKFSFYLRMLKDTVLGALRWFQNQYGLLTYFEWLIVESGFLTFFLFTTLLLRVRAHHAKDNLVQHCPLPISANYKTRIKTLLRSVVKMLYTPEWQFRTNMFFSQVFSFLSLKSSKKSVVDSEPVHARWFRKRQQWFSSRGWDEAFFFQKKTMLPFCICFQTN